MRFSPVVVSKFIGLMNYGMKPINTVDELIHLARLKLFLFNPNSDLRCEIYGDKKNAF